MARSASTSISILLRIHPDSQDPRQQRLLEWYERQPAGPSGKKLGLQHRLLDLIDESLAADVSGRSRPKKALAKPAGAPAPTSKSRKPADESPPSKPAPSATNRQEERKDVESKKKQEAGLSLLRGMEF